MVAREVARIPRMVARAVARVIGVVARVVLCGCSGTRGGC